MMKPNETERSKSNRGPRGLLSWALFFSLLMAAGGAQAQSGLFCYQSQWGTSGTGNSQFNHPTAMALDLANGWIYAMDWGNNRVQKFDLNGNWLATWGGTAAGSGNGQFDRPTSGAVALNGDVYILDQGNNRVQVLDPNGNYLGQFGSTGAGPGEFNGPNGLCMDPSDNVYVADGGNNRVEMFGVNGNFVTAWGAAGSGNGQFDDPADIQTDASGNLYVADTLNYRIQKFDANGDYLTQWGSQGTGAGQFEQDYSASVGTCGSIYASDYSLDLIQVFDPSGHYLGQFGAAGPGNGQFNGLQTAVFDNAGNAYTIEAVNDRVQKFTVCGITCVPTPSLTPIPTSTQLPVYCNQFTDSYGSSSSLSNYTFYPGVGTPSVTPSALNVAVNSGELQEGPTTGYGMSSYAIVNNAQFSHSYNDYTVEADFKLDARTDYYGSFGLEFLEQSNLTGYNFMWNGNVENSPPHWIVEKDTGPSLGVTMGYTFLGGYGFGQGPSLPVYTPGNWIHLKVVVSGGVTFNCYANLYDGEGDRLVFGNLTDTTGAPVFTSGGVGIRSDFIVTPNLVHVRNFNAYACFPPTPTSTTTFTPTSTPTHTLTPTPTLTLSPTPTPSPTPTLVNPPSPGDFFIYPSPARGSQATVSYDMAQAGAVDLRVWNEKAEMVAHVTDEKAAGVQETSFSISGFATGVYFYSLTLTYGSGQADKLGPKKFAILR